MLFSGFNVSEGHQTLLGIIVFGLIGDILGASIAYAIGYYGRRELLERHGSKLHVSTERLDRAHRWLENRGTPVIFFSRMIPFFRAVFPYVAGVAEVSFTRFLALTAAGSVIWMTALGIVGKAVGSNWETWRRHLEVVDYVVVALVVLGVVYLVIRRMRRPRVAS
jgi:membrane protein DedA with SNARE-associated domain